MNISDHKSKFKEFSTNKKKNPVYPLCTPDRITRLTLKYMLIQLFYLNIEKKIL